MNLHFIIMREQANTRLATRRDEDDRLPIHWAVSYNHRPIVELLISRKDFDPDVQVGHHQMPDSEYGSGFAAETLTVQDASGWTPLMIASSLKEEDGLVDLLLGKGADATILNNSGQVITFLS